jgi:hypothetical protein
MSNTLEPSQSVKPTRSTPPKPIASKDEDLQLVAERLSLIQGHISQMPHNICISGVVMMNGFLLVALKINGHELSIENGTWMIDKKDITLY